MSLDLTFDVTTPESYLVPTIINQPLARRSAGITIPSRRAERWVAQVPRNTSAWRAMLPHEKAAEGLRRILTLSTLNTTTRAECDLQRLGSASETNLPQDANHNRRAYLVLTFLWVCEVVKQFGQVPLSTVNDVQRSLLRIYRAAGGHSDTELGDDALQKYRLGAIRCCRLLYKASQSPIGNWAWVTPYYVPSTLTTFMNCLQVDREYLTTCLFNWPLQTDSSWLQRFSPHIIVHQFLLGTRSAIPMQFIETVLISPDPPPRSTMSLRPQLYWPHLALNSSTLS